MRKITGIINLHTAIDISPLTYRRSIASTGFLGRYGFIDFALSNLTNSGISEIGVLIKDKPRSMFRHLGSGGKQWSINTKVGGLFMMYNERYANSPMYNTDVDGLLENHWFLKTSKADYVVICPVHMICKIDYSKVVENHIQTGADITLVYKDIEDGRDSFIESYYANVNSDGRIISLKDNKGSEDKRHISLETYVMKKDFLLDFIEKASKLSSFFTIRDMISFSVSKMNIHGYEYKGYLRCFDSIQHYMQYSLELLDENVSNELFDPNWPIYTRSYDTPPTQYGLNAKVSNCLIANGSSIDGEVTNSVIGRDVVIPQDCKIDHCVILSHVEIAPNTHLQYVVVDKEATIIHTSELIGTEDRPYVIKQEDVI